MNCLLSTHLITKHVYGFSTHDDDQTTRLGGDAADQSVSLAQGKCPSPGRPPWSHQFSSVAMPQTQPTIGQSQLVSQSAGYTPASWYSALSHTQSSSSCGLPPRRATGQSLAPSILPSPFSMLLTSTDTPANLCTCVLWTSNQPTIRSSGSFFGACYSAWGCTATC